MYFSTELALAVGTFLVGVVNKLLSIPNLSIYIIKEQKSILAVTVFNDDAKLDEFWIEFIILGSICLYFAYEGLKFCIGGFAELDPSLNKYGTIVAGFFAESNQYEYGDTELSPLSISYIQINILN